MVVCKRPSQAATLRRLVAALGVAPHRFITMDHAPLSTHRERIAVIDLMLDSTTYTMHSTGAEALWAGVPTVTVAGPGFASRVGMTMNAAARSTYARSSYRCGMRQPNRGVSLRRRFPCATTSHGVKQYEAIAVRLASCPACLVAAKQQLSASSLTSSLFDTAGTTAALKRSLRLAWDVRGAQVGSSNGRWLPFHVLVGPL